MGARASGTTDAPLWEERAPTGLHPPAVSRLQRGSLPTIRSSRRRGTGGARERERRTACDFAALVQKDFCATDLRSAPPVASLQALVWASFCDIAHYVSGAYPLAQQVRCVSHRIACSVRSCKLISMSASTCGLPTSPHRHTPNGVALLVIQRSLCHTVRHATGPVIPGGYR